MDMFKCGGFNGKDRFCVKALDDKFAKYLPRPTAKSGKQLA